MAAPVRTAVQPRVDFTDGSARALRADAAVIAAELFHSKVVRQIGHRLCSHSASGAVLVPQYRYFTWPLQAPVAPEWGKRCAAVGSLRIERTPDGLAAALQDMRIDHSSAHIFMPQEFLHGADVVAIFQQMRRETMA